MKMIRSFCLMGAAMLLACLAFAVPTNAIDRMHDPGLYAAPTAALDEIPAPLTVKDFIAAAHVDVAVDFSDRSTGAMKFDEPASTGEQIDRSFIDLRLRC